MRQRKVTPTWDEILREKWTLKYGFQSWKLSQATTEPKTTGVMSVWLETQGPGIAAANITTLETQ